MGGASDQAVTDFEKMTFAIFFNSFKENFFKIFFSKISILILKSNHPVVNQ